MPKIFFRTAATAVIFSLCGLGWSRAESSSANSARAEALGPSSRRGPLVISEIMHDPAARADGKNLQFVELFNSQPWDEDISGHRLSGDVEFTFPAGTLFPARSFLVVAQAPADIRAVYGIANVFGPYSKGLSKKSGKLRLHNETGAVLLEIDYDSRAPWPAGSVGTGHSLVLARPSYGENDSRAWALSDRVGGSPGAPETLSPEPLRSMVINEFLLVGTATTPGFVELFNYGNTALDIGGCSIGSDHDTQAFTIPSGTLIPGRGFVSFSLDQVGLKFSTKSGVIFLWNRNGSRLLDAVNYEGQGTRLTKGRFPDGADAFYLLENPTPAASNSPALASDVVINEIMYDPISGEGDDQYVELFNRTARSIDLSGWQFAHGIDFTFPLNTTIPGGGYLVVAKNAAHLRTLYPNLNSANTRGNFSGSLSHHGERVALARPEAVVEINKHNSLVTNVVSVIVDEVRYGTGGRWGMWAHGGGSSLELLDPRANHRLPSNWADSDETQKSDWVTIQHTGRLEGGSGAADALQVMMLGEGECLLDNVEVRGPAGTNILANGDFEKGMTNWVAQGTHVRSRVEAGTGVNGSRCLHIRASEEGDTGANRIWTRLTPSPTLNQVVTIRAQVRWLRGHPEILLRLKGNYLEATGNILTRAGLGTPGLPNSVTVPNAGPAIYQVKHTPVLPLPFQRIVVSAHLDDPDGISSVRLHYRLDPSTNDVTVPMVDDGSDGDAVANDGVFTATIPGQSLNAMIAFYVEADDGAVPAASTRFPNDAPARECLVRVGDPNPQNNFGTYRLWLTQKTVATWANREILSHEPLDGTFVYGDFRAVYNARGRYTGSPYHQSYTSPVGAPCQYTLDVPEDDHVLGTSSFNKIHAPGNSPLDDPTIQAEQTAYWIARQVGLPYNYKRYVQLFVNGNRRGQLMEDTMVPGSNILQEFFPHDPDGFLHKLYGWFEFANSTSHNLSFGGAIAWATLQNFVRSDGQKNLARYRWNWRPRAARGSVNNFTNLYALVDAANVSRTSPNYVTNLLAEADIEEWMRTFAVQHAVGNWDSYGNSNGQNTYAYKPTLGRWELLIWDFNIVLGNSGSDGPAGDDLFKTPDPVITAMYNTPVFRRTFWRAMKEIVNGPMLTNRVNPFLDARYAAFRANGISVSSPTSLKSWIARRRPYLLSKLNAAASEFAVTDFGGADFSANQNPVTVKGTAPVEVRTIKVNGLELPVTWTSVTNWSVRVPLTTATNTLVIEGFDQRGAVLSNATATVNVALAASLLPKAPVLINEWMAANGSTLLNPRTGTFSDWFELYNASHAAIDLGGYSLTDDLNRPTEFIIPKGSVIPPRGFLLVWADASTNAAVSGSADLHANFKLSREGGEILLYAPDAALVDAVSYSEQITDVSQGRFPDGALPPFYAMQIPTPRGPNQAGPGINSSPQIIGAASSPDGSVTLRWRSVPGKTYHLQFKRELRDSIWQNLIGDVTATGTTSVKTNKVSDPHRFYRIQVVE